MNAQRRRLLQAAAGSAALMLALRAHPSLAKQESTRAMSNADQHDGSHDFDFYFGRWHVANERLKERLVGSNDWEHFEATQECHPILGGVGNIDDFQTAWGGGFTGMTLRLFNIARREWSLYWASNRDGVLEPPVVGRFENGVGTFLGRDQHKGTPVLARFMWSHITPNSALWQQAFSTDEGKTWETNWIMRMTRIGAPTART